jgi:hypothetical protein
MLEWRPIAGRVDQADQRTEMSTSTYTSVLANPGRLDRELHNRVVLGSESKLRKSRSPSW